ncbi:MAG TPA: hypothetical protein VMV45_06200, partial [Casimicrobiaceae bacterium]|nr:hypothetical protein [Casimicrobiaceae bacterium]
MTNAAHAAARVEVGGRAPVGRENDPRDATVIPVAAPSPSAAPSPQTIAAITAELVPPPVPQWRRVLSRITHFWLLLV